MYQTAKPRRTPVHDAGNHTAQRNWTEFIKTLKEDLTNILPPTEIESAQDFNTALKNLNEAIQNAIEKHVKLTKPSPYSKRWWTSELASEKKKIQQLGGKSKYHRSNPQHPIHEKYRQQRNRYSGRQRQNTGWNGSRV
jgi:hypothetical protein